MCDLPSLILVCPISEWMFRVPLFLLPMVFWSVLHKCLHTHRINRNVAKKENIPDNGRRSQRRIIFDIAYQFRIFQKGYNFQEIKSELLQLDEE